MRCLLTQCCVSAISLQSRGLSSRDLFQLDMCLRQTRRHVIIAYHAEGSFIHRLARTRASIYLSLPLRRGGHALSLMLADTAGLLD